MIATDEKLALEDNYTDVLKKAQRGLKLADDELAERAGLSHQALAALHDGQVIEDSLRKVAHVLHLHADTLVEMANADWYPQPAGEMDGFAMATTWYGDMTVNAFLVWDPQTREAASFDTGSDSRPLLKTVSEKGLTLKRIFITHTHQDHLADLARLQAESDAASYGSAVDNPLGLKPLSGGDGLMLGNLRIRVLATPGHTPGGLSYFVEGLAKPLIVVGDALFASSMGGAAHAYAEALRNNREKILSLPPETVVCPGHGPLTTVGEERAHNPFYPEFKERR